MKALVVCPAGDALLEKVAEQVKQGAAEAGGGSALEASVAHPENAPNLSEFDLIFVAISAYGLSKRMEALSLVAASPSSAGSEYRVFCVHSGGGKSVLEEARAVLESKKAFLSASLLLEARGFLKHFGRGSLGEGDFARAKAFGERGASSLLGGRNRPQNEKQRIPGYRK